MILDDLPGHTAKTISMRRVNIAGVNEQYRNSRVLAKETRFDGLGMIAQGECLIHNFLCAQRNTWISTYDRVAANMY